MQSEFLVFCEVKKHFENRPHFIITREGKIDFNHMDIGTTRYNPEYVEVIDEQGKHQTIVSNKIHPFFTQVNKGERVPSSEGHHYNGEIQNAQWVDAQNLKAGYKLLSENNH